MTAPRTPHPDVVAAFTERVFRCHHCGATGPEERDTDQVPGPVRYRYLGETLLLPFCPGCGLDRDGRWQAGMELVRAVERDTLAWVDPDPLPALWCTRTRCARVWHHLGGPLPYPVLHDPFDERPDQRRHPCPWCVDEDVVATTADHHRAARALADLHHWESELQEPS